MNTMMSTARVARVVVFLVLLPYLFLICISPYGKVSAQVGDSGVPDASPDALAPWVQTNGPSGGIINTVKLHPTNPGVIFAGGMGGLFRSNDAGLSWQPLAPFVQPNQFVYKLLIDPTNPQVMYALSDQLFKTTNGGTSWLPPLAGGAIIRGVAMNPANPQQLLAGLGGGQVWLSTNGGATWDQNVTSNLPGTTDVRELAIAGSNEFWAGPVADPNTYLGYLYHTTNGGGAWSQVSLSQSPDTEVHSILVDKKNPAVVYVAMRNVYNIMFNPVNDSYLFKTVNGGGNWAPVHIPWTDSMIDVMGIDPTGGWVYVGTGAKLFKSTNGQTGWINISPPNAGADGSREIAVHPSKSNVLYIPSPFRGGIYASSDGGVSWIKRTQGMLNTSVSLLALGSSTGSVVYASTVSGEGTFRTTNSGVTWTNVTEGGISHPWADELAVSPTDPQTIWEIADVSKLFISQDGGINWNMALDPQNGYGFRSGTVQAMEIASSDSNIMYAVKSGFGIFKSPTGGASWNFLHKSEVDYSYSLAVHPTDPDIVFSGYNPKPFQDWAMVRRSTDGGDNWSTVLNVPHSKAITSVAINPTNPDIVYAGSTGSSATGGGKIFRSLNGGDNWGLLNSHFTMLTVWGQPQLTGDPNNPSTAYAATWLGGTWKTTNAGQTWTKLVNAPLSSTSLSLDPNNAGVVYAGDRASARVWKSTDGGTTWISPYDFSSQGAFLVNRVLAAENAVYASTFGPGYHGGKLYKSTNGGFAWQNITASLPRSVLDIAVDPTDTDIIYVTTHIYGAYRSDDGGVTWAQLVNFPNIGGYDIEVDPVSPNVLYAAGMGNTSVPDWVLPPSGYDLTDLSGVYRSDDSGQTWNRILSTSNEARAIRLHPSNHNLLFAAALSDGFFVSADGGGIFSNDIYGLDTHNLTSVWAAGNKIYAGTQGFGVYSGDINLTTGDVTWVAARSNKPVPDVYNLQIRVDPTDSNILYVGANPGGLFRSDDGGATWFDKNFLTPSVVVDDPVRQGYYTFAINPVDPSEVWVGTWGKGVYKSYDRQDFNIGANGNNQVMFSKHINALLFHPILGVLAATEEGVFRTADGGNTWVNFSSGLGTTQVRTLNQDADGTLYAGTAGYEEYYRQPTEAQWTQLRAFSNFGTFWPIWNDRPLYQYSTLLFHPTDPNVVYWGTFPAGIFKTLDGGSTWREYNVGWPNDGVFSLVFQPGSSSIIYAGTYNGISRSLDSGGHWETWANGWPGEQWVFSIAFDPLNPQVMYACSKNGTNEGVGEAGFHGIVMKSLNGGESWFPITTGLDVDQEFYKLIADKFSPNTLYLATQKKGVFITRDGGAHWQPWNAGLTNLMAGANGNNVTNTLAISADGKTLYFGTAGSGVFRRMTVNFAQTIFLPLIRR